MGREPKAGRTKSRTAKTAKKTAKPALVPQPNGRGALLAGGMPGNAGGGRRASEVIAASREAYDAAIPYLTKTAQGIVSLPLREECPKCGHVPDPQAPNILELVELAPKHTERVNAARVLGQFAGLGSTKGIPSAIVQDRVYLTLGVLRAKLTPELYQAVMQEIKPIWNAPL